MAYDMEEGTHVAPVISFISAINAVSRALELEDESRGDYQRYRECRGNGRGRFTMSCLLLSDEG